MWTKLVIMTIMVCGCGPDVSNSAPPEGIRQEVLHQTFSLRGEIVVQGRAMRVPVGWDNVPEQREPDNRWIIGRWDGGNDPRMVERNCLVTNRNGLPGCWLTKILSYEVGPEFELTCIAVNYGTPAVLTMRVVDDKGFGYDAVTSRGVESEKSRIRKITKRRSAKTIGGKTVIQPEQTKDLAISKVELPSMERLQWYRVKLSYKNTQLTLAVDDRVLVQTRDVEPRTFTAVQFMSPQRIFLDDIEMWGMVQD